MIKLRNALVAGTMLASALVAPMAMQIQSAGAATATETVSVTSAQKPCWKHRNPEKCYARNHGGGGGGGHHGGGGDSSDFDDDFSPGGGGSGINN
ncbi:hypothetical protein [Streptosporangium sp. NBC_01756]|uniref:hypothetical protein n=1 Tax=Streptosporangium sp. NBC_01756 TaxID=2975950 RepID=UPI002DD88B5D|nr:hypothetical protein [Streptosporangium sp. NBC_01756]WSC83156.1 hypothetical protein OIE48_22305 [Streptosporangium sp. NBC_01756]